MGFLQNLFSNSKSKPYVDKNGLYFYVVCDHCKTAVRVRADKLRELNHTKKGYSWHKTIVDANCFRPMQAIVQLDHDYEIINAELEGGQFINEAAYEAQKNE